jgi:hypothetical protein
MNDESSADDTFETNSRRERMACRLTDLSLSHKKEAKDKCYANGTDPAHASFSLKGQAGNPAMSEVVNEPAVTRYLSKIKFLETRAGNYSH